MDTHALRIVVLVARHGSFAAAARVLNVDPSTVSRLVSQTEAHIGTRLFQRSTRHLTTTEEGETYLRRIEPLLDELDHAREEAAGGSTTPSGTLRMTASVAFAHVCIVPNLGRFRDACPRVTVELIPTDTNLDIHAGGIDLAVRLAAAPVGDLIGTRLIRTRYRVCASPDYLSGHDPLNDPADLQAHECLRLALPEYRTRWRFRAGQGEPIDVPVSGRLIVANALSLRSAARNGLGPALLADWLIADDVASGRLVDVFPDFDCTATEFDTGAWALYPSRRYLPGKVRAMIEFLRTTLPATAKQTVPNDN